MKRFTKFQVDSTAYSGIRLSSYNLSRPAYTTAFCYCPRHSDHVENVHKVPEFSRPGHHGKVAKLEIGNYAVEMSLPTPTYYERSVESLYSIDIFNQMRYCKMS